MKTAKPVFDRDSLRYEREERDGYYTFVPKWHPETRELIVNATSKLILDLCDGSRSLEEIGTTMREYFPAVQAATIEQDLLKTVGAFSRVGVVSWIGENPFLNSQREPIDDRWSLAVGQEDKIEEILELISSKGLFDGEASPAGIVKFVSPEVRKVEYGAVPLRSKLFSYSEEFMLLYAGDDVAGLVGIAVHCCPRKPDHLS